MLDEFSPPSPGTLGRDAARSGAMQVGSQGLLLAMYVVSGMLLARLLSPADFGIMAMAGTLTAFVSVVRGFGLSMAVVHAEAVSEEMLQDLFSVAARYATMLAAGMLLSAPILALLYGEPRLVPVLAILTIGPVALSLSDLPEAIAARGLRFAELRRIEIASTGLGTLAGLLAAWMGAGFWALVLQAAVMSVCRAMWAWQLVSWRPVRVRRRDSPQGAMRRTRRFAREYSATSVVTYVAQNIDRVALGITGGPYAIGLYDNAYRWALYPVHQLYPPLLSVAVAGLSRARADASLYRRYWRLAMLLVLSAMVPGSVLLALEADAVIRALLGSGWIEAVPVFRLVAIGAIALALSRHSRWLFLSEGRTARQLRFSILQLGVTAIAMVIGVQWGVTGVAAAYAITRWLLVVPELAMAFHRSRVGWRDYLAVAFRPVLASGLAGLGLLALDAMLPAEPMARLLAAAVTFTAAYSASWVALPGGWTAGRELLDVARRLRGQTG